MNKKKRPVQNTIIIYETAKKGIAVHLDKDTVWLSQKMIADVFETTVDNVGLHLKNIYSEAELQEEATTKESSVVQQEGARKVKRKIKFYNLDAIIAVGYRINSKKATRFRQWATNTLRVHLVDGYTINKNRVIQNYKNFIQAVADVKSLLPAESIIDNDNVLELIKLFADTWFSLDAYDKDALVTTGATKRKIKLTAEKLNII